MKLIKLALITLLIGPSAFAAEGGAHTGGGHAVVCFSSEDTARLVSRRMQEQLTSADSVMNRKDVLRGALDQIVSVRLLDLYESRLQPTVNVSSVQQGMQEFMDKFNNRLVYAIAQAYPRVSVERAVNGSAGISPVDDSSSPVTVAPNCVVLQVAVQSGSGKDVELALDVRLYDKLPLVHQFALQLHEALYAVARDENETSSRSVRRLVRDYVTGQLDIADYEALDEYLDGSERLGQSRRMWMRLGDQAIKFFMYGRGGSYTRGSQEYSMWSPSEFHVRVQSKYIDGRLSELSLPDHRRLDVGNQVASFDLTSWTQLKNFGVSITGINYVLVDTKEFKALKVYEAGSIRADREVSYSYFSMKSGAVIGYSAAGDIQFARGSCSGGTNQMNCQNNDEVSVGEWIFPAGTSFAFSRVVAEIPLYRAVYATSAEGVSLGGGPIRCKQFRLAGTNKRDPFVGDVLTGATCEFATDSRYGGGAGSIDKKADGTYSLAINGTYPIKINKKTVNCANYLSYDTQWNIIACGHDIKPR